MELLEKVPSKQEKGLSQKKNKIRESGPRDIDFIFDIYIMSELSDKTKKEFAEDFVKAWANFVKNHDRKEWKPQVKNLVDSQIIIANRFYRKLEKTKGGKEKIKKLLKIENENIFD